MRRVFTIVPLAAMLAAGCAVRSDRVPSTGTLAELREVEPDLEEAEVEHGLEQAMEGYRRFLEETPETEMTPDAMRRLADLQLEKRFGIRGGEGKPREMAAPETGTATPETATTTASADATRSASAVDGNPARETELEFETRATATAPLSANGEPAAEALGPAAGGAQDVAGPLEAIALYDRLLERYPGYEHRDQVLYQKARAYDELGRTEEAIETMEQLIGSDRFSEHYDEVQFRRGEYFFTRKRYLDAERAYGAIIGLGPDSSYHELALYKLGWTFYKQELYEEALHRYVAVLDHRLSAGYDFDQAHAEEDERRIADTFRVISLSFSNLGGPEEVERYFARYGTRPYEDRVYANLGEHYLEKLRYDDAAKTFRAFVELHPFHREAPRFGMRVVETFTKGGFPKLVLEAKREFAATYGLRAEYWRHLDPELAPETIAYLKSNLDDLATHYHAQYQETEDTEEHVDDKLGHYREARRWYGDYLDSFPEDDDTPPVHYRLADLLLEHGDFGEAAREYERTAYDYPEHDQSSAAGYAAVYAHRRRLEGADEGLKPAVMRDTVDSSLRFADTFSDHEQAATVLGAAADDLYRMTDYREAVDAAQRVVDDYPAADAEVWRSAWIVVAHGSFDLADYPRAESAYAEVLAATPEDDEAHAELVDNLAASIYKQGELASDAGDARAAADHFLRIREVVPTSTIRATAEYDAGAALMTLEAWGEAAGVLERFRVGFPEHELGLEATRLIAHAYREDGQTARAAEEYDRVASETDDPALRSDALLTAGELYEASHAPKCALDAYGRYVAEFPQPVELALETRVKIAEIHEAADDTALYHDALAEIVRIEAEAGADRTVRTRTLAARSALVLAERLYDAFGEVELTQPFEASLEEKQARMDLVMDAMGRLVDYEISDVTAAATYYMAETYFDFSRALFDSERPTDLDTSELAEYELALEETAFPFEEKSIDLHEENLELLHAGVFNGWTEKSLGRLADRVPGRYAKDEMSAGFIAEIDRFEYRSPSAPVPEPTPSPEDADTAEVEGPMPAETPVETTRLAPNTGGERSTGDPHVR